MPRFHHRARPWLCAMFVALITPAAIGLELLRPGYARPTELLAQETPLQALCRVRAAFLALPQPAHRGFKHHEVWTRRPFGAPAIQYGPFEEIQLDRAAARFVTRHSRLEIVAAVAPFTMDAQRAPQAVAVLAGLPVADRERLDQVQNMTLMLAKPGHFVPGSSTPPWNDEQQRYAQGSLPMLYGPPNATHRLQARDQPAAANTLEAALLEVLAANEAAPDLPAFQPLLQRWPRAWLGSALFPLAFDATGAGQGSVFARAVRPRYIHLMGRDAEYGALDARPGHPGDPALQAAYQREAAAFARSLCPAEAPR